MVCNNMYDVHHHEDLRARNIEVFLVLLQVLIHRAATKQVGSCQCIHVWYVRASSVGKLGNCFIFVVSETVSFQKGNCFG